MIRFRVIRTCRTRIKARLDKVAGEMTQFAFRWEFYSRRSEMVWSAASRAVRFAWWVQLPPISEGRNNVLRKCTRGRKVKFY